MVQSIPEASMQKHNQVAALRLMSSQCLAHTLLHEPTPTLSTLMAASNRCTGTAQYSTQVTAWLLRVNDHRQAYDTHQADLPVQTAGAAVAR
jgi:hypothetical protein